MQQALAATEPVAIKVRNGSPDAPPAPRPPQAAAADIPPLKPGGPDDDFWHSLVQQLVAREAITALVRELALQSQLVARSADAWTLRTESASLAQPGTIERLRSALAAAGHSLRLQVEIGHTADTPARRNQIAASQRLKSAEALLMADPFVQEMLRDFGARIIPGSIKAL